MRIVSIGGGPAGLYFSLLMKKAYPFCDITVYERNRPDDTFGWGVVFSDETLSNFEEADPESFKAIRESFAYWSDIETHYGGEVTRSTGHGFCGLSRKKLLQIFHDRCRALGVKLEFQKEVTDFDSHLGADLVLAADGVNSAIRSRFAEHFQPSIGMGKCKFSWLGSTLPLGAFTFIFRENEHGLWQIHAYPFEKLGAVEPGQAVSTFIVECHESVWKRAGLDQATEEQTVAYFEKLFADHLGGHRLLSNRSIWRTFPTISCARWSWRNVVLMGDAVHTAHFSIGSGTKLAMEDAIALARAFQREGGADLRGVDVPKVLAAYEDARRVDVLKIQKTAQVSREWFEHCARYMGRHPTQFTINLMTRSKAITWDNLRRRDPKLVDQTKEWFAREVGMRASDGSAPEPMFAPLKLRSVTVENRVVVSPMCQYSATDGMPNDWQLVHLGSRAIGGAGLVFTEATDVSPEGRITLGCTGLWNETQAEVWKRIVDFVHAQSRAKIGIQIAHAGRKGSCRLPWEGDDPLRDHRAWQTLGPSADPFGPGWPAPRAMTRADMDRVRDQFVHSTRLAARIGFDIVELHYAHGYLLSSFLSPKSNRRTDEYGGSLENRMRWPLEVFEAARAAWPSDRPMFVRISASDWLDDRGGFTADEAVIVARELAARGCDVIDVSSAGNTPESKPDYGRMYQLPFAEKIRYEAGVKVMAVGAIQGADHVNTIIASGRADLCAIARAHLSDPYLTLHAAERYGYADQFWPNQYLAVKPRRRP
ncbi:MAG: bifunctional salicylyl-CoA 5-hydroxylase/oxidoreductase [Planctomycetes bacterium]|nr:bifunctional salicylyl-CoA 5-hydroxylase/oxidoreductase [Planctomycetota bacterium]